MWLATFTHFCPSEFLIDTKCIQWFFIVLYCQHLQTEIFFVVWGQQKMLREQNSTFSTTVWFKLNTLNDWLHHFTLSLPEVCKTEFLLTIWRQYQADKYSENKENDQFMDYKLIQNQILWTDIIKILWQKVRRINDKILGVKGLMQILNSNTQEVLNLMFI